MQIKGQILESRGIEQRYCLKSKKGTKENTGHSQELGKKVRQDSAQMCGG